jgi:hypothetical protein
MPSLMALADIVRNALDKDYSLDQAATDLGELTNEREGSLACVSYWAYSSFTDNAAR